MICLTRMEPASGRDREPVVPAEFRSYVERQVWRRGLRHPARRAEGVEVALQLFAIEAWRRRRDPPVTWRAWRALLDRAVYLALKELRPCAAAMDLDAVPAPGPAAGADPADGGCPELRDRVERLPVAQRLVVKLKLAALFLPELPGVPVGWRADEVVFLLQRHPGRSLAEVEAEFHQRLVGGRRRYRGKVPSPVIAWLLGRASGPAVDSAFLAIKDQLRRPAPPGPAVPLPSPHFSPPLAGSPPPLTDRSPLSPRPNPFPQLAA